MNMMADSYDTLLALVRGGQQIPANVLIELAPLQNSREAETLEADGGGAERSAAGAGQAGCIAGEDAKTDETQSKTIKNIAQAKKLGFDAAIDAASLGLDAVSVANQAAGAPASGAPPASGPLGPAAPQPLPAWWCLRAGSGRGFTSQDLPTEAQPTAAVSGHDPARRDVTMSGGVFGARGSTGPAPTTVFFGGLAERLNMIFPGHDDTSFGSNPHYDLLAGANYFNQWTIWNQSFGGGSNIATGSFGGSITAPDGTNTARKFVESTSNTEHFVSAACIGTSLSIIGKFRFAAFLQYAGRRVALSVAAPAQSSMSPSFSPFQTNRGFRAIFDLANGQIGLDSTAIGSSGWTADPAVILPFGGGWYLCYFDVFINSSTPLLANGQNFYCYIQLDNGTGTNAASLTYTGDGSSGVYGWRTNVMPPAAYAMNSTVFFDDFLDSSRGNFDLTNSLDPTKTWFIQNGTPYVPNSFDPVTPIADIPVSNSILNIKPTTAPTLTLATFAALNQASITAGYVGQGWKAPFLFECNFKYDMAADASNGLQTIALWTWSIEYVTRHPDPSLSQGPAPVGLVGREFDIIETSGGGGGNAAIPRGGGLAYWATRVVENQGNAPNSYGFPVWDAVHSYATNTIVSFGGAYYKSLSGFNLNNQPPNGVWWSVYTGPPQPITIDWNQYQTIGGLVIPYTSGDIGKFLLFVNGQFSAIADAWSPTTTGGSRQLHVSDGDTMPMLLGGAGSFNSFWDWVRVTQ